MILIEYLHIQYMLIKICYINNTLKKLYCRVFNEFIETSYKNVSKYNNKNFNSK